jgi:glycosyltransferase involved in cell wall biosynthesis
MIQLSSYVLTKNSEKHLAAILEKLELVSDEIIVMDSGSIDKTKEIALSFPKVSFHFNEFVNFKDQRVYAENTCQNHFILFLDSDEIPTTEFINSVLEIKKTGMQHEAYTINRKWKVLGKFVHCLYPVVSPDSPVRLYDKRKVSFKDSQLVHESLSGFKSSEMIKGDINHITFETREELHRKLELYTDIAAEDLIIKRKNIGVIKLILNPIASFIKWYITKKGFKDGYTGFILGKYAYNYTLLKYLKARKLDKSSTKNQS